MQKISLCVTQMACVPCVCRRVLMTDRMGYIANLINPVLQVRKSRILCVCVCFLNLLPVIVWSNRSLSSCIEPLFHFKEPLPIYYLQIFYGCAVTQSHGCKEKRAALLCPLAFGEYLILTLTNSPQVHDARLFFRISVTR